MIKSSASELSQMFLLTKLDYLHSLAENHAQKYLFWFAVLLKHVLA